MILEAVVSSYALLHAPFEVENNSQVRRGNKEQSTPKKTSRRDKLSDSSGEEKEVAKCTSEKKLVEEGKGMESEAKS